MGTSSQSSYGSISVDPRLLTRSTESREAGPIIEVPEDPFDEVKRGGEIADESSFTGELSFLRLQGDHHNSGQAEMMDPFTTYDYWSDDTNGSFIRLVAAQYRRYQRNRRHQLTRYHQNRHSLLLRRIGHFMKTQPLIHVSFPVHRLSPLHHLSQLAISPQVPLKTQNSQQPISSTMTPTKLQIRTMTITTIVKIVSPLSQSISNNVLQ